MLVKFSTRQCSRKVELYSFSFCIKKGLMMSLQPLQIHHRVASTQRPHKRIQHAGYVSSGFCQFLQKGSDAATQHAKLLCIQTMEINVFSKQCHSSFTLGSDVAFHPKNITASKLYSAPLQTPWFPVKSGVSKNTPSSLHCLPWLLAMQMW